MIDACKIVLLVLLLTGAPCLAQTDLNYTPVPVQTQKFSVSNRAAEKYRRYHWYELTDDQSKALRNALMEFHTKNPVLILSANADSLPLAEDFDSAFHDVGIKSNIDHPMDTLDGLHCTSSELAGIITKSTGIPVIVDPPEKDVIVLNFGRKVPK